jgi:type I restriction enzyme, S subunit
MTGRFQYKPLIDVAPAKPVPFPAGDDTVWHLSLEDIQPHTGVILRRTFARVADLGPSKVAFDERHVLYSKLRPYLNKVAVPDSSGVATTELIPLAPDPNQLDRDFLAFFLRAPEFVSFATQRMNGANLPRVPMREFWQREVPLPRLEEQKRIVGKIRDCLSRIEEMSGLNEDILAAASALELSAFNDALNATDGGRCAQIPLGDVLLDSQYGTSAKATDEPPGAPVLRMGNIQDGHLTFKEIKYICLSAKDLSKYLLQKGDVLINRTNSLELVGKAALFDDAPQGDWVFASYLIRLRVDESLAMPRFVAAVINSQYGREYILRTARRAIGMVNINAKEIAAMPIPLPSMAQQESIVNRLADVREAASGIVSECDALDISALRNSVLRDAFSGDI